MTFTDTGPGQLKVTCNGTCGAELQQTDENKGAQLLDFMRDAGWAVGSNLCPACQDGYGKWEAAGMVSFSKDAWDSVVEVSPGVWTEAPPPAAKKRRRKIHRLL